MEGKVSELGSALTLAGADRQSSIISGKHMVVMHVLMHVHRATRWVLVDGNMS